MIYLDRLAKVFASETQVAEDAEFFPKAGALVAAIAEESRFFLGTFPNFVSELLHSYIQDEKTFAVVIYGSQARGDARRNSDWDFLVVREDEDPFGFPEEDVFFNETRPETKLYTVFAEEVLIFGKVVHAKDRLFEYRDKTILENFLDPSIRRWCLVDSLSRSETFLRASLEEFRRSEQNFAHPWHLLSFPMGDLRRSLTWSTAAALFWLRPELLREGLLISAGQQRKMFEVLAERGVVPPWSFAVYEVVTDLFFMLEYGEDIPFLSAEFLRLVERVREHVDFVKNSLRISKTLRRH